MMDEIQPLLDHVGAEVDWGAGFPHHESKRDAMFYRDDSSFVCKVKISEFAVDVYCDGITDVRDRTNGERYRDGADLIRNGYDTDEKLNEATDSGDLEVVNNSWFDLYCDGEHLDTVSHDIYDAIRDAITWLQQEKDNALQIENVGL
jgi:hypothetical protein